MLFLKKDIFLKSLLLLGRKRNINAFGNKKKKFKNLNFFFNKDFINLKVFGYTGRDYIPMQVKAGMLRFRMGSFVFTTKRVFFRNKKIKKK